ncbi:hypothetical protein [Nostoc sp.]|uniref:hypothetical protein n=1 Tax=Nostoc sp. TaxID=1180 RepID=UPI002FF5901A
MYRNSLSDICTLLRCKSQSLVAVAWRRWSQLDQLCQPLHQANPADPFTCYLDSTGDLRRNAIVSLMILVTSIVKMYYKFPAQVLGGCAYV